MGALTALGQAVIGDVGRKGGGRASRVADSATNIPESASGELAGFEVPLAQSRDVLVLGDSALEEAVVLLLLESALRLPGGALLGESDALDGLGARLALVQADELGDEGALEESSLGRASDCEGEEGRGSATEARRSLQRRAKGRGRQVEGLNGRWS